MPCQPAPLGVLPAFSAKCLSLRGKRILHIERRELPEIAVGGVQRANAVLKENGREMRIQEHESSKLNRVAGRCGKDVCQNRIRTAVRRHGNTDKVVMTIEARAESSCE